MSHTLLGLRISWLAASFLLLPLLCVADYKLSVTPRFAAEELLRRLTPLSKHLSEALGEPVEIIIAADFADYEKRVASGEIDIAYSNSNLYPLTAAAHEVVAMESTIMGPKLRGLIITRADSDIVSIEDLMGRAVSVVGFQSTGGFLSQKLFLEERGIDVREAIHLQEARGNKQENVILCVYFREADAGFIREDALHIADQYVPSSQIRVIARTAWLPNWALSVKRKLPNEVKQKILSALLALKPGNPVLEALEMKEFVPATDADYDVIRRALGLPIPAR